MTVTAEVWAALRVAVMVVEFTGEAPQAAVLEPLVVSQMSVGLAVRFTVRRWSAATWSP